MEKQEVELRELQSPSNSTVPEPEDPKPEPSPANQNQSAPSIFSTSGMSSWTKNLKFLQSTPQEVPQSQPETQSAFTRISSGFGLRFPAIQTNSSEQQNETSGTGIIGSLKKGIVDSSMSAVKAVQVKARHMVSQNKRRFQADGFDLDMTYITDNIIAMGFPAGDLSSGLFGYFEGFYRNHMEEVIRFFETHHKDKYKVYNLCSERLYDASLLEGKVACFPFDDHNCPPIGLIKLFCESASSWLREDNQNVVVVHCKAGMGRTGLMISSLLLYLKSFGTAEECIEYFNQKRCVDSKGLVLPSQIRYVEYFEHMLTNLNCQVPPGRRCMLRGFRLHNCPNWIRPSITVSNHNGILFSTKKHPRTKDMSGKYDIFASFNMKPGDFWFKTPKKGIMVFGLPGEPGLAEVTGDFKVFFQDRYGDFYCWLNTTLTDNRKILNPDDLDGFDKRKLPSPGFQIEAVLLDYDPSQPLKPTLANLNFKKSNPNSSPNKNIASKESVNNTAQTSNSANKDKDEVFSDSDNEQNGSKRVKDEEIKEEISERVKEVSLKSEKSNDLNSNEVKNNVNKEESEFKAISADASVFSFGDDEEFESE